MLKQLIRRILVWRLRRIVRRSAVRMARQIESIEAEIARGQRRMESEIDGFRRRLDNVVHTYTRELEESNSLVEALKRRVSDLNSKQEDMEAENEGLRSRLRVSEDITIPTLVEAHRLVLKRWEKETEVAVQSRGVLQ